MYKSLIKVLAGFLVCAVMGTAFAVKSIEMQDMRYSNPTKLTVNNEYKSLHNTTITITISGKVKDNTNSDFDCGSFAIAQGSSKTVNIYPKYCKYTAEVNNAFSGIQIIPPTELTVPQGQDYTMTLPVTSS